jgi:ribosomal protein L33
MQDLKDTIEIYKTKNEKITLESNESSQINYFINQMQINSSKFEKINKNI